MTDQNLPISHRTTGVRVTLAALVALGIYACGEVSSTPDDGLGNGGSAGASAGSSGSSGSSGAAGSAGAGGGAGSAGSSGSAGSGGSSGGSGGSGSSAGTGGSSGAGGSSAGSSGSGGTSSDPDAGSDPDAALPDGGEPPVQNLISNSDFESGIAPWTAAFGGTLAVSTEQARSGLQSAKVSGRTQDYQGAHYDVTDSVTAGASYTFTAFARIAGATATAPVKATARVTCSGVSANYLPIRQLTANDNSWTEVTGTLTVPTLVPGTSDPCTLVELLVYVEGPPADYDLFADDVSMFPL